MFEIGAILLAAAQNYAMLILGRVFLGVAVRGAAGVPAAAVVSS